jgi:uncharacterized protein (TIGR03435 family)
MHFLCGCTPRPRLRASRLALGLLLAAACTGAPLLSEQAAAPPQSPAAASSAPQFDVAAIHPYQPEPHERSHIVSENGRFTTVNVDLKAIIQWAYDLPQSRIVGGPSWLGSARWDVEATAENALDTQKDYDPAAARAQKRQMVQALLADRFHIAVHEETRDLPIYNLVVARGGAKFLESQADGTTVDRSRSSIRIEGGDDTVSLLAEALAETLGRVVIDKTGITGRYKLALAWTPDDTVAPPSSSAPPDAGPSIFTALQEQLGLRLEPAKGPVRVLVIDHAEMASPN